MLISEQKKKELYANFQKAAEYNTHWLNSENERINLKPEDHIILSNWSPLTVSMKVSFKDSMKRFGMLCVYFGIYALISYFVTDRGTGQLDATMQALFFPLFPFILVSYRSIDKYLKALLSTFFVLLLVFTPMVTNGLLSEQGIPFLRYFFFIDDYFPGLVNLMSQAAETSDPIVLTGTILRIIFIYEFFLLILYWIFKKRPYIHLVASEQALFIRAKTKKSVWDVLIMVLWIILNPFNISQYKEIQNRIRYNRLTAKEGRNHDYSQILRRAIKKWTLKKSSTWQRMVIAIAFSIIGVFTIGALVGIPLLGIGIILFFGALRRRNTYKIYLKIKRSLVEGSWVLSHQFDVLEFPAVPEDVAQILMKF
ncbi:MAG: hypothetical protein ACTSYI_14455 [Promethearchaeota archaeon]